MEQLQFGLRKPQTKDKGSEFFPALEELFDWVVAHKHTGSDSQSLSVTNIVRETVTLSSNDWTGVTQGFTQVVDMPSGLSLNNTVPTFKIVSGSQEGTRIYPTVNRITDTQFEVIINDNSFDLEVSFI
tara:strand:+ start:2310 stop:2693 length:384 start_codon:yes stop_codon:yes gene_type:complete